MRTIRKSARIGIVAAQLVLFILSSAFVLAQTENKPKAPISQRPENAATITVKGCLYGGPKAFGISDADGKGHALYGLTSTLQKYVGEEITVQGIEEAADPIPSLKVVAVKEVFKTPKPKLSAQIADASKWRVHVSQAYGVRFATPAFLKNNAGEGGGGNFVSQAGTITLAELEIPRDVYADTNFVGGSFSLSVNSSINNRESCEKFAMSDRRLLSRRTFAGTSYVERIEADAALGTAYGEHDFHTFQNGLCYEVSFRYGSYNTANQDLGCTVPSIDEKDVTRVIEEFAGRISYFRPASASRPATKVEFPPVVASFTASSQVADAVTNRGTIDFSWTTKGADYVELSYHCSEVGLGVVILEGGERNCENDPKPIIPYTEEFNRDPDSSTKIIFGNSRRDVPISIIVTITPFSRGAAYPSGSKSLTVTVDPYNPFPEGIPATTANISLNYSDEKASYAQGATITINWTDTLSRDPCVNLYLLQERSDGRHLLAQIVYQCLRPAAAGSYKWTIPDNYSGSGFRIYAAAPGRVSSAFGPVFSITSAESR
jgi:hypothetical protein